MNTDEQANEFKEFMSNGYSGGESGLRCDICDSKYSGTSGMTQLCPVCRFKQITK